MFKNASEKCTEIINFICKDKKCKESDVNKGPQIQVKFGSYEYKFFSDDYLFTQGEKDKVTIHCRFQDFNVNESCPEDSVVIGKAFYNKYVPVMRFKRNAKDNNEYTASIAWLPYFDNYKRKNGLKWAMIGISIAIVVLLVFIVIIQKVKKSTPEDYHQVQG